jgi:hypothetical protein
MAATGVAAAAGAVAPGVSATGVAATGAVRIRQVGSWPPRACVVPKTFEQYLQVLSTTACVTAAAFSPEACPASS